MPFSYPVLSVGAGRESQVVAAGCLTFSCVDGNFSFSSLIIPNRARHRTAQETRLLYDAARLCLDHSIAACEPTGVGLRGRGEVPREGPGWSLDPSSGPSCDIGVLPSLLWTFVSRAWDQDGQGQQSGCPIGAHG